MSRPDISVVVPLYNEAESLPELVAWIDRVAEGHGLSYEAILVDDGSSDASWEEVERLKTRYPALRGIRFARNYGKSAALYCGFAAAAGEVVVTMDADLQDDIDAVDAMLEQYYAERNTVTRIRQKSADLRHVVQTALERNRKKYDLQLRQLKDTESRDKYKVYGELINTYGYNVAPGEKKLEALNYYTNEIVSIPLDPVRTPQENAQRYFAKYNKQKRTFEALTVLCKETAEEISYLESVQTALDIALTENDLAEIKEELTNSGYIRRRYTKKKVKIKNKPLHYISSDGFHIYVGKNNLQNDQLTFHFAVGNDWWFHAKQAPGSHVIVRTNGAELPDTTFEEAARLAAYYSSMRGSDKVEIDYVEKKQVKKPGGGKPGFVVYYTNYSMVIDSNISQIRLCAD